MGASWHGVLALLMAKGVTAADCFEMKPQESDTLERLRSSRGRESIAEVLGHPVGPVDWGRFDEQVARVEVVRAEVMCCWDVDYPETLRVIDPPAPLLFYKGSRERLRLRGIAVVGTRKPTSPAVAFARRVSRDLSAAGIPVVSGLARGIDTAAHTGALGHSGGTVAVIGTGVDVPYPAENAELMVEVGRAGCVVSEQLMGMHPSPHVFPRRNRLISALSHAVVVVEGGMRSGALITARWALDQGRDVGAVPGFPGDFRSQGPNSLLRQGAFVVEGIGDILDAVPMLGRVAPAHGSDMEGNVAGLDAVAVEVLATLGTSPADPDAVASVVAMDVTVVQQVLMALEIDGHVIRDDAGRYTRAAHGENQS